MRRRPVSRQPTSPKIGLLPLGCHRTEQMVRASSNNEIQVDHDLVHLKNTAEVREDGDRIAIDITDLPGQ